MSGTFSSEAKIESDIPQGSILGPLLFLIYVNDMPAVVKHKSLLYADDATLLVHGKNLKDIESSLSSELEIVNEWLISNKLSLHLGKWNLYCLVPNTDLNLNLILIYHTKVNQLRLKTLSNIWGYHRPNLLF